MNKKVIKTIEKIEECSIEEAVNDFLDDHFYYDDLLYLKDNLEYEVTTYFEEEDIEYSEEEKKSFIKLVERQVNEKVNSIKESEIKHLSNRKSIYKWLSELLAYMCNNIDPGDVGFLLSVDEIIDLIAQNANKE